MRQQVPLAGKNPESMRRPYCVALSSTLSTPASRSILLSVGDSTLLNSADVGADTTQAAGDSWGIPGFIKGPVVTSVLPCRWQRTSWLHRDPFATTRLLQMFLNSGTNV